MTTLFKRAPQEIKQNVDDSMTDFISYLNKKPGGLRERVAAVMALFSIDEAIYISLINWWRGEGHQHALTMNSEELVIQNLENMINNGAVFDYQVSLDFALNRLNSPRNLLEVDNGTVRSVDSRSLRR